MRIAHLSHLFSALQVQRSFPASVAMQLLCPRGLWSCTFFAAHSAKLHAAHRRVHHATTLNLEQTRALRVRPDRLRELGLTVRGGVSPCGDGEARQKQIRPGVWTRRRRPREQGGVGLNGLPKQLRFLSSLARCGFGIMCAKPSHDREG